MEVLVLVERSNAMRDLLLCVGAKRNTGKSARQNSALEEVVLQRL
jgi:hypothetical protein